VKRKSRDPHEHELMGYLHAETKEQLHKGISRCVKSENETRNASKDGHKIKNEELSREAKLVRCRYQWRGSRIGAEMLKGPRVEGEGEAPAVRIEWSRRGS
jgi:hypothetical protein